MKDRQAQPHKRTQRFILGNPHGEENPTKIPLYKMYKKYKIRPQTGAPPSGRYIYIYPMSYTQMSVCSNEEQISSIYTLLVTWLLT